MTPKKFSPLLLLCFTTPVSGFREVDHLPETFCITYLSTYLVAISGVQTDESSSVETSFLLSSVVDDFTSDTQDRKTSYSISLDDPLSTLATEVSVTRSFLTNTETSTADPTVIPGPDGRAVVFRVIPSSEDNNRRFYRRALGGFVGSQSDLCEDAVVYNLSQDRLYEDGLPIYYNSESYKELRGQAGPLPRGAVTTAFLDDGGFVEFVSSTLPGGRAGFCQVLESGQVYLTFGSSPPDCAPVRLSIIGVEECSNETSTSDILSTRTSVTGPVEDLATTTSIPVETSIQPVFTEATSTDLSFTEDPSQTKSFVTTVRLSNSSTTSINSPVDPTRSSALSPITIDTTSTDSTIPISSSDPILPTETDIVSSLTDAAPIDNTSTEPIVPRRETSTTVSSDAVDVTSSSETDILSVSETNTSDDIFSSETTATTSLSVIPIPNTELDTTVTTDTTTDLTTESVSLTETSATDDTSTALETSSVAEAPVDTTETTIPDTSATSGTEEVTLTETSTAVDTSTTLEISSTAESSVTETTETTAAGDTTADTTTAEMTTDSDINTTDTTATDTTAADTTAADTTAADTNAAAGTTAGGATVIRINAADDAAATEMITFDAP
ncbi:hypothetical protein FG05_02448 [Fusarium graminearum]|nr:hypothetical protein FG05_02448 [Fusarium graminearum]